MLLRRITQHVKAQNWFAVGIDFLIVIVGVFIGIQVANWNDARRDRENEALYLERLEQELSDISPHANAGHESVRGDLERMLHVRERRFSAYVSDVTGRQSEVIESLRATIASGAKYELSSS